MKYILLLALACVCFRVTFSQPIDSTYIKNAGRIQPVPTVLQTATRALTSTEICNNNIDDDNNGLTDDNDFGCYFKSINSTGCKPNSVIWGCMDDFSIYWTDATTGAKHFVGKTNITFLEDITWASDGKLYGIGGSYPRTGIWEIDPNTASPQYLGALPDGYSPGNSLTADNQGNLYMDVYRNRTRQIIKLNLSTWKECLVADFTSSPFYSAGDLTFLNGYLYLGCPNNTIAQIDVRTGAIQAKPIITPINLTNYGLTTLGDGYLYSSSGAVVYQIDPSTMVLNQTPFATFNIPNRINGLASYSQICQAPKCAEKVSLSTDAPSPWCPTTGVTLKSAAACQTTPLSFSWNTPDGNIVSANQVHALSAGKYYLNYSTAAETCNHIDSFDLQYPLNYLKVDTSYRLPFGCSCTGSMSVTPTCGSGNYRYEWSTGANTAAVSNICPGTYTVKVTDVGLSTDTTISFNLTQKGLGVQNADIVITADHCNQNDGSITITNVSGGIQPYTYSLNNQPYNTSATFPQLRQNVYTVNIKENTGCIFQKQVTVPAMPGPEKIWLTKKDALCGLPAGSITIDSVTSGSSPYTFSINNASYTSDNTFSNVPPGQTTITAKDQYGCTLNQTVTIDKSEQLIIELKPKDTLICASKQVNFNAFIINSNGDVRFKWNNSIPSFAQTFETSLYENASIILQATDKAGCTAIDSTHVIVDYCDSVYARCIIFPNAFSPNGDGLNDNFGPHLTGCIIKNYLLTIFNRWGQIIFQTRDMLHRWNGEINGNAQGTGTYLYTCTWTDASGINHNMKGTVVLVK